MRKIFTVLLLLVCSASFAQQEIQEAEVINQADQYFNSKMESDHIVGLSAAVILNGKVIWTKGFGYADLENKIAMTPQTVVNIGSITKTFTALALMQLNERGKIDIDKPLAAHLPQFHPKDRPGITAKQVTIKSVITHTSGIQSDIWKNSDLGSGKYTDVPDFINQTYLLYPAGMAGLYSNAGYNILGNLIKTISHEDYPDYIHRHIFAPLGMIHSGFAMDKLQHRSKIYAYGQNFKTYELRDIASGGIYADMADFAKYAAALLKAYRGQENNIIGKGTIRHMFSLQNGSVPLETNKKGLGWFMFKNDSTFAVYHSGSAGFAQAKLLLFPEKNAAVIVMTNTAEGGPAAEDFCFNMLPKYGLNVPDLFPAPITGTIHNAANIIRLNNAQLQKHSGSYARASSYVTLSAANGFLNLQDGSQMLTLRPLSDNEFAVYEVKGKDTIIRKNDERFFFKEIHGYHYLLQRIGHREYNWGYRLKPIDTAFWKKRTGLYEQFGYQLLIGDSKFKSAEIYVTADRVLMCRLKTMGSTNEIPLDVINSHYTFSSGLNSGFGGFNVKFIENGNSQFVDFGGIMYRKSKQQKGL